LVDCAGDHFAGVRHGQAANIGSDLGVAVKGFKQGVKEAESLAELEPQLASRGTTVEVDAKEAVRRIDDFR
jgi:sec-independent protein translocase protein TatA